LKGSSALYTQLYEAFEDKKPEGGWNKHDRHDHTPEQIQWLIDHGCEYHKVTADPGDLLLWDSVSPFVLNKRPADKPANGTLRRYAIVDQSPYS
jgi:hypothetical protein